MPEPLEREVTFDIGPALSSLQDLDRAFEESATRMADAFSTALSEVLGVPQTVDATVETDASDVTSTIDEAVAAADESFVVDVDANAGDVTETIDDAVSEVDTVISFDADVSDAEADLAGLEGETVTVGVTTETGTANEDLQEVGQSAEQAGTNLNSAAVSANTFGAAASAASGQTSGLSGVFQSTAGRAGIAGAAVLGLSGFVGTLVEQAQQAERAQIRFTNALGAMADEVDNINIGGLVGTIEELSVATGSTDEKLQLAAARIADLGRSSGATEDQIAATAEQVLALALHLSATNPALGDAGEVAEGLTNALARGGRALAKYGIALSQDEINARAFQQTTATSADQLSLFDKTAAGASIRVEQLGDKLGTEFAAGTETAAVRFAALKTQLEETLETLGAPLVAPVLAIMEALTPAAEALAEVLARLAATVLPVLVPVVEVTAEAFKFLADSIQAIPTPILIAIGAFVALRNATAIANAAVGLFASGVTLATNPIGQAVLALAALGAAMQFIGGMSDETRQKLGPLGAVFEAIQDVIGIFAEEAEKGASSFDTFREKVFGSSTDLATVAQNVEGLNRSLIDLASNTFGAEAEFEELANAFSASGLSIKQLTDAAQGSQSGFDALIESIDKTAVSSRDNAVSVEELTFRLDSFRAKVQDAALSQTNMLGATEQITEAQLEAAIAAGKQADGTFNYVESLESATASAQANVEAEEKRALAAAQSTVAFDQLRAAVLAGQDIDVGAFAEKLGVQADEVQKIIDETQGKIDEFANTAVNALPSSSQAFDTWHGAVVEAMKGVEDAATEGPKAVQEAFDKVVEAADPARLIEQIQKNIQAIEAFQGNLTRLIELGLGNVVNLLVEKGPEVGGALAQSLVDNEANARELNTTLGDLDTAYSSYDTFIRTDGAPLVIAATEEGFAAAAATVPGAYDIGRKTGEAFEAAVAAIQNANPKVTEETAASAVRADEAFAGRFLPQNSATGAMGAAGEAISANAPTGPAGTAGSRTGTEFGANLGLGNRTRAEMQVAAQELFNTSDLSIAARSAGRGVGQTFGAGIVAGIQGHEFEIEEAARAAVRSAEGAARSEARAGSPSKLFAELGRDLMSGLAEGLDADDPVQVAEQIVRDVAAVIEGATLPGIQVGGVTGAVAGQASNVVAGTQTNSFQFDVAVSVNGAISQTQARTVGVQIADAAAVQLRRRDVIARVRAAV